jgi:hypothetical protein
VKALQKSKQKTKRLKLFESKFELKSQSHSKTLGLKSLKQNQRAMIMALETKIKKSVSMKKHESDMGSWFYILPKP